MIADFETSSGDPSLDSLNPWHHCNIAGLAIRTPHSETFYIPNDVLTTEWLKDTFCPDTTWINHNVKYDAHVMRLSGGHAFDGTMIDTATAAKLLDSDRWEYGLDGLCKDWLKLHGKTTHLIAPYLWYFDQQGRKQWKSKDYGDVPEDKLGDYACDDVNMNWQLYKYIKDLMPEESYGVWQTEIEMTKLLTEAEAYGMLIAPKDEMEVEQAKTLTILLRQLAPKLEKMTGRSSFEPHKTQDCLEVFHERMGLPILDYTEKGNPSFNKHVLKQYIAMPGEHQELVKLSLEWKSLWQFNNLYLDNYLALSVEDVIHGSYNQCVRTGRMSCSMPNMQQLDKRAKSLIRVRPGHVLVGIDYSQVEFRIIVHYIQNRYALQAYEEDPDTDFHTWVAEMVGIPRSPAKNINFMLGYGGGKKKTLAMLQDHPDLMTELREQTSSEEAFKIACVNRASQVYKTYHGTLPELKQTSNDAGNVCRRRGYVRNLYGRRRRLPPKVAHIAFNTLCQSTAADLMKERAVALWHALEGSGVRLLAIVHDEVVLEVPEDVFTPGEGLPFIRECAKILETPSVPMRVPIRCDPGFSRENWAKLEKIKNFRENP